MTIHWQADDPDNPTSIDVWHKADDGTVTGPVQADVSTKDSPLEDAIGGVAPDAVRERLREYLSTNANPSDPLWQAVVLDAIVLDYERGPP